MTVVACISMSQCAHWGIQVLVYIRNLACYSTQVNLYHLIGVITALHTCMYNI